MRTMAAAALLATTALAAGLAAGAKPWLTAGAGIGVLLLLLTLTHPLEVVGGMLVLGAVDLSFMTGGFKSLLAGTGGLDMNGIRLIGLVVSLGLIVMVNATMMRQLLAPQGRWYAIFLAYACGTLVLSPDPLDGTRLLFKLAYPLLVFVVVAGAARGSKDVERLGDWTLLGAAAIAFVVNPVFAIVTGGRAGEDGVYRIGSIGVHQNPFSFYLLAMLILAFVRLLERRQARYAVLAAALGVWMVLTYTRITFLAALVALALLGVAWSWMARSYKVLAAAAVAGAALCWVLLPVVLERTFGRVLTPMELIHLSHDPARLYASMNWEGRQALWPLVFGAFLRTPWLGLGLGATTRILGEAFGRVGITVAHNEYLRLVAETGVVGALLYVMATAQWARVVVGVARGERTDALQNPGERRGAPAAGRSPRAAWEYAMAGMAILVAWGIIALTDNAFDYYSPLTQYAAFYCAAALAARAGARREQGPERGSHAVAD